MGNARLLFFSIFVLVDLIFSPASLAALSCSVKISCDTVAGEVTAFKMSFITNAHAALPSETNPPYENFEVCCGGVTGLGNSCTAPNRAVVLRLSAPTNAHVQENTFTNYPNPVCLSLLSTSQIVCGYANNCASLGASYTCVASISGANNAHVGRCDAYPLKVCCSALANFDFTFRAVTTIITAVGQQSELKVDIHNLGAFSDRYSVTFTAAFPNIIDISNSQATTGDVQSDQLTSVSTLIRPLTDGDNIITINVLSINDPSLVKPPITVSLRTAKFSLPEFGFFGFLQIMIGAAFLYLVVHRKV